MNHNQTASPSCVITGGTSGIGLATAKLFSRQGYRVAICGRRENLLSEAKSQIAAAGSKNAAPLAMQVDLHDPPRAREFGQAAIDAFGRIDVLVNNAEMRRSAPFAEIDTATFESVLDVNLRSVFH